MVANSASIQLSIILFACYRLPKVLGLTLFMYLSAEELTLQVVVYYWLRKLRLMQVSESGLLQDSRA